MSLVEEMPELDVIESAFQWTENLPAKQVAAENDAASQRMFAGFLCWMFDELVRIETHYRQHRPRSRTIAERFHGAYQVWIDKARKILADGKSLDPSFDTTIGLGSRIEAAEEILSEFSIGAAGAKRLAELFREEEAEP